MKTREEFAHVRLVAKSGFQYRLPTVAYDEVNAHWDKGKTIWRGEDLWGARIAIRLADIVSVTLITASALAAQALDDEEYRRRELTNESPDLSVDDQGEGPE